MQKEHKRIKTKEGLAYNLLIKALIISSKEAICGEDNNAATNYATSSRAELRPCRLSG